MLQIASDTPTRITTKKNSGKKKIRKKSSKINSGIIGLLWGPVRRNNSRSHDRSRPETINPNRVGPARSSRHVVFPSLPKDPLHGGPRGPLPRGQDLD